MSDDDGRKDHQKQSGLAATGRSSGAHIEAAVVALAINQRITHVEILRHPDDGVISRIIAMRVIFTDDITDDSRRLHIGSVEGVVQNIHGEQNSTMHGLQAVAHIRQSTANNDTHGIVEVGLPEFIFDVN